MVHKLSVFFVFTAPEQKAVAELCECALLSAVLAGRHGSHCRLQPGKVKGVDACTVKRPKVTVTYQLRR
jgi:hypothetical protein